MNHRLLAIELGQLLKYSTSLREIERFGSAIFDFTRITYPNEAITSQRAQLIYDWVMTLANQHGDTTNHSKQLLQFCRSLAPDEDSRIKVDQVLQNAGFILPDATIDNTDIHHIEFRKQMDELLKIFDDQFSSLDPQRRGYMLQELLAKSFPLYEIPVIKSFTRNEGAEQIDGAFKLDGWHYIVECRWRKALADIRA